MPWERRRPEPDSLSGKTKLNKKNTVTCYPKTRVDGEGSGRNSKRGCKTPRIQAGPVAQRLDVQDPKYHHRAKLQTMIKPGSELGTPRVIRR